MLVAVVRRNQRSRGIASEAKGLRIDGSLKPAIDRQVGAVDPSGPVGAKEGNRRRDIGRSSGAADPRNVAVDPLVAEHGAELEQDRGFDRSGADRIDANAAALEKLLMRRAKRPQQQRFFRDGIAFAVLDAEFLSL